MKDTENLSQEVKSLIDKLYLLKQIIDQSNEVVSRSKYKYNEEKQKHELDTGFYRTGKGLNGAYIAMMTIEDEIFENHSFGTKRKRK